MIEIKSIAFGFAITLVPLWLYVSGILSPKVLSNIPVLGLGIIISTALLAFASLQITKKSREYIVKFR